MLEMYRRRGFESLSEAERHVLSELMLGALVEVQQTCREIHEALRVLDPLSKQVNRLCEWHEEVADGVRDVLEDRRAWKEDVRSIKRSTWEKAVWAALVAIVALLLAIAGIRQVAGQEPTPESSSAAGPSAAGPSASVEVRRDAPSCWAPRPPGAHAKEREAGAEGGEDPEQQEVGRRLHGVGQQVGQRLRTVGGEGRLAFEHVAEEVAPLQPYGFVLGDVKQVPRERAEAERLRHVGPVPHDLHAHGVIQEVVRRDGPAVRREGEAVLPERVVEVALPREEPREHAVPRRAAAAEEHAARRLIPRRRAVDEREGRAPRRAVARQLPRAVVHGAQPLRLVPAEGTAPQHPEHLNQ